MAKLSRQQIQEARKQLKEVREQAQEALAAEDPKLAELKEEEARNAKKKDKRGFTRQDRNDIRLKKDILEITPPKISWNYEIGDLVYLPDKVSIGIIVKNNAVKIAVKRSSHDLKQTMKNHKYAGQVYVVTSSGNQWFYPNLLKKVKE